MFTHARKSLDYGTQHEVKLTANLAFGRGSGSFRASTGEHEAVELRDGDKAVTVVLVLKKQLIT